MSELHYDFIRCMVQTDSNIRISKYGCLRRLGSTIMCWLHLCPWCMRDILWIHESSWQMDAMWPAVISKSWSQGRLICLSCMIIFYASIRELFKVSLNLDIEHGVIYRAMYKHLPGTRCPKLWLSVSFLHFLCFVSLSYACTD